MANGGFSRYNPGTGLTLKKFRWIAAFALLGFLVSMTLLFIFPLAFIAPAGMVERLLEQVFPHRRDTAEYYVLYEVGIAIWVLLGAFAGAIVDWDVVLEKRFKS